MLFAVRNLFLLAIFLVATAATALVAQQARQEPGQPLSQATDQPSAQQGSSPQQAAPASPAPQGATPPPAAAPQPAYTGPVIVLDPAHGGTDTGARGDNGVIEKDIVLQFARAARIELVRQGYRVVMTRNDDSNPSYDDRAAMANSYRDAIFISLHVSSTGTIGTARAYYYQFWTPLPPAAPESAASDIPPEPPAAQVPSLTPWNEAQRLHEDASHLLADQIQIQLAQLFTGSPEVSQGVAVRGLRSVDAPAIAIEISSVAAPDVSSLEALAAPLATSIVNGLHAFHAAAM